MERRKFLKAGVALGGFGVTAVASVDKAAVIRGQFDIDKTCIPMNAANLCPALKSVQIAQAAYGQRMNRDVSFVNRRELVTSEVVAAREAVAAMLRVRDEQDIALLRNTSEANSIINNGLDLAAEDEVLAWEENHPTNRHSWRYRAQRHRFTYRELALPATLSDEEIVQQFKDSLTRKTRVVTFSHLSNVSGRLLPAQAICEMVHKFDPSIWVHIDGAQSWGSVALDLPALGCDSFSSSGHKWLMGPRATGILYVRSGRATEVWPATLGYDFTLSYPEDSLPENAQRFELLGQRDPAPFAALTAAVETQHSLGGSLAVQNRIAELTRYTREAATAAGLQCLGPANAHGVTVIDLNNAIKAYGAFIALHNEGIAAAFVNGSRICCEPEQGMPESGPVYVRLSPHLYNSVQEIDQAIATIRRINESPLHIVKELLRFI